MYFSQHNALKFIKIVNIAALLFLLLSAWGLAMTGALQVTAALIFVIFFPKNKLIYCYFGLVATFFIIWDRNDFDWTFIIPIFLIGFLTYIFYNQKTIAP